MPEQFDDSQARGIAAQDLQLDTMNDLPKLRAMRFGELLDTTFSLYRTHFWTFFGIASGYFIAMTIAFSIAFLDDSIELRVKVLVIWPPIFIAIFGISTFVVSRLFFAGAQACLGNTISVGEVLRQGRQFLPYFVGSFLFGVITIFCVFLSGFVLAVRILFYIRGSIETVSVEIGVLNFILRVLMPLLIVVIVGFFITYWSFFVSATLLERTSMRVGFRRSRELISGRWWHVVGTVIAIFLLAFAIGFILRTVFASLLVFSGLEGVGSFTKTVERMALWKLPTQLSRLRLSYALMYLIMPIWVIGFTRLYFDQRIRKEGFDIEMMAVRQEVDSNARTL